MTKTLILVAGMGLISSLSLVAFLVVIPRIFPRLFETGEWEEGPPDLLNLTAWLISATGMTFYVRFVANSPLSIAIVIRIVLICLAPSIYFRVNMRIAALRLSLDQHKKSYPREVPLSHRPIEIRSDDSTGTVIIPWDRFLYIKAADNYVEVFRQDDGEIRSLLIRTTVKRACADLKSTPEILQCHRAYVINIIKVENLRRSPNGYFVEMRDVTERIPVSRTYQVRVKEALKSNRTAGIRTG